MPRKQKPAEPTPRAVDVKVPAPVQPADPRLAPWMAECAELVPEWSSLPEIARRQIAELMQRQMESPSAPRLALGRGEDGKWQTRAPGGKDELVNLLQLHGAFASPSGDLIWERVGDLISHFSACGNGRDCTDRELGAALAFVAGVNAKDPVQSALAVQMAAVHDAAMAALRLVGKSQHLDHIESGSKVANKLLNTFARQAEVLAKLQRGGEQVVKHIHIDNRGGQAVVTEQVVTRGVSQIGVGQSHEQPIYADAVIAKPQTGLCSEGLAHVAAPSRSEQ